MTISATTSDIQPCLTYADAPAAIDWLCRVFGFTRRLIVHGPDGSIRHSELSLARIIRDHLLRSPQVAPGGVATSAPPWQRSYGYASVVDRRSS
ncbi:MAG: hypothetical protein AB7T19_17695 [Planctomycetota bacterium]